MSGRRPPVAAFITLGCKANRYDTGALMALTPACRYRSIDQDRERGPVVADVYVINTCAVTGQSAFQCRQMVRRARKWNPAARIIVTGCLAAVAPESLVQAGADLVTAERERVVAELGGAAEPGPVFFHREGGVQLRGRAVVKVQDGCDQACAYCIVRVARGRSRSLATEEVLHQLRALAGQGFAEAVLTGIHLGFFGRERGESLVGLLRAIAAAPGMPGRIRLSSLDPPEIGPELIALLAAEPIFCPHLHLPLQSGDPDTLRRMNRTYTVAEFRERTLALLAAIPRLAIGLDVIAGFPAETDAAHRRTVELIADLPVAYLHVFPFSARPGTPAARMRERVPQDIIKARAQELRDLGAAKKRAFLECRLGMTLLVLAETRKAGMVTGTSDTYLKTQFAGGEDVLGTIVRVRAEKNLGDRLEGKLEKN